MRYQLAATSIDQKQLEKTVYVLARCMSFAGFQIPQEMFDRLTEGEKQMFIPIPDEEEID